MVIVLLALLAPTAHAADDPNEVTLGLDEFLRLYETTKNRPDDPIPAPVDWAISSARYDGEVILDDGEPVSARFKARMHIDILKDKNWTKVPLLPVTVGVESARIGNAEASIVIESGWYWLVTDRHDAFDVDITFAASVESYVGASGVAFELTPSGATELTLAVPSSDALDFTVANARYTADRQEGGKRIVEATLPSNGALSVQWQRESKGSAEQGQTARVYAQVYTLTSIGDGVLHENVTVDHTILFAGVKQLQERIPDGMTLLDVKGSGIRDWRLGDDHVLTVDLNYAAEGAYTLNLEMERVVGEGSLDLQVPIVQPLNVERSKGFVGVEAHGNLEVAGGTAKDATQVDVRTLPAAILGITANPVLLGYKYLANTAVIPLTISAHQNVDVLVTVIDQTRATTMFTRDGRRLTSVAYDVRNNRRQFLRLSLPEGAELWSAAVAGRAVQPAKGSDGRVLVPLIRSQGAGGALAAFTVEVVYVEEGTAPSQAGSGTFEAELPKADAPSTYVGWSVYAPGEAKIKKSSFDGSLRDVDWLSFPFGVGQVTAIETYTPDQQRSANGQMMDGATSAGSEPVPVKLPLEGIALSFEKVLALDERLWVSFDYSKIK